MDTTVRGIGAVVVAEVRAAGYMESTVAQYAKTIKGIIGVNDHIGSRLAIAVPSALVTNADV